MDLLGLVDFNLVARHGGFGRAARAAGRPKTTLSRRVADLEESLGLRLFERGTSAARLTQEGQALYERTNALLTELDETAAAIASGSTTPRGKLRISVPLLFSQIAMGKLAAEFALKYPDVRLEVVAEDRAVDMIEAGYDLVIRVDPDPEDSLVGRIFLRDRQVIVASPHLIRPADMSMVPAVLRGPFARSAIQAFAPSIAVHPVLSLSTFAMVRDAVRAGVGVGRLPLSFASRDLAAGTLVCWGDVDGPETELWALYPTRRLLNARVSAFLDHLKDAFPSGTPEDMAAYIAK